MGGIALADSEWILMQILWRLGECTVRQITEAAAHTGWTRHTVISYLNRMEAKGAVARSGGRPGTYRPLLDRERALREETGDLLGRIYGGEPFLMAVNAVRSGRMTKEEKKMLIQLIEKE